MVPGSKLDVARGSTVSSAELSRSGVGVRGRAAADLLSHRRIATEIHMHKELSEDRLNDYRARTPLTPKMLELLKESSSRTWHLLWSGNLM